MKLSRVFVTAMLVATLALFGCGDEYIFAMCEGNLCTAATSGGGRLQAFKRTSEGNWAWSHQLEIPLTAEFEDYAGISYRDGWLAVVSQDRKSVV